MRVFVTGIAGFVGRHLVPALARRGALISGSYLGHRPEIDGVELFEAIRTLKLDPVVQIACSSEEYGLVLPDEVPIRRPTRCGRCRRTRSPRWRRTTSATSTS